MFWHEHTSAKQQLYLPSKLPSFSVRPAAHTIKVMLLIAALWFPAAHQTTYIHVLISTTHQAMWGFGDRHVILLSLCTVPHRRALVLPGPPRRSGVRNYEHPWLYSTEYSLPKRKLIVIVPVKGRAASDKWKTQFLFNCDFTYVGGIYVKWWLMTGGFVTPWL